MAGSKIVHGDIHAHALAHLGELPKGDPVLFDQQCLRNLELEPICGQTGALKDRHNIHRLIGHICAVLVTVLVLEGWSSALKPEHSVLTEVKNLVAVDTSSWMERLSVCVEQWMEWAPVLPSLDTV